MAPTEAPEPTPPPVASPPDRFPPFAPGKAPTRLVTAKQISAVLSHAQMEFLSRVDTLAKTSERDDAREALRLLDTVPEPERFRLEWVSVLEQLAWIQLDRHDDAARSRFRFLCAVDDEAQWLDRGLALKEWFLGQRDPTAQDEILAALREVADRVPFAVPRLMFAWLVEPGSSGDERLARREEAVLPARWRVSPERLHEWLHELAYALHYVVTTHHTAGRPEQAERYASLIPRYPWRRARHFGGSDFFCLAGALYCTKLDRQLERLAAEFRDREGWGSPGYWLGLLAEQAGQGALAAEHYRSAIGRSDVNDGMHSLMAQALIDLGHREEGRRCVELIRDRDGVFYLQADAECLAAEERFAESLARYDALVARAPDRETHRFQRLAILLKLERFEDFEREARRFIAEVSPAYGHSARGYLAEHLTRKERATEALEVLAPYLDGSLDGVQEVKIQVGLCTTLADTLAALHDDEAALRWYDRALALGPGEDLRLSCAGTLVRLGQYDRAETLLGQVRAAGSTSAELGFLQLLVDDHFDRWPAVIAGFDRLGLAWLREQKKLREGLGAAIRAWLERDRPDEALGLCVEALEDMLADEHLRGLWSMVVQRVRERLAALRSGLEGERQRRAEEQQQSDRLRRQVERQRERELVVHRRAEAQRLQLSSLRAQAREAPAPVHPPALPAHLAGLRPEVAAQLRSALLIHAQLAAHPDADHGPVVVQLARVLEGEVNRVLVDALVELHLAQGGALEDFPGPAHCPVVRRNNRWSLGEAAELLTTRLERPEADGSVTLVRNPRSDERHERLLAAGFDRVPESIRTRLPLRLREVARLRNRAGHAGAPLSRQEAEHLRGLVLGDRAGEGLLAWLLGIEAA